MKIFQKIKHFFSRSKARGEMTFKMACAQGDVYISRVQDIPKGLISAMPENGRIVVTHSETGHDHVMQVDRAKGEPAVEMFNEKDNPLISWLKVNRPTTLEHLRPYDTHESILFNPGSYKVHRQREYTLEPNSNGFRQVYD